MTKNEMQIEIERLTKINNDYTKRIIHLERQMPCGFNFLDYANKMTRLEKENQILKLVSKQAEYIINKIN